MALSEHVIVRNVTIEDAESVLSITREVINEGVFFIHVPQEFHTTIEQQIEFIQKIVENENEKEIMLVAEVNHEVAGWIVFYPQHRKRMSHLGSFTITLRKHYRGMGIGKMLLKEFLEWAEKNPYIEKVCLGVFSTNLRAISLYKSMGFVEEGRKIKEFKINDNEYIDDILMYKLVT